MSPSLLPPFFFFIKIFLFLSLFMIPTYFASNDAEGYKACAPFSCGNFSEISYPFWSSNQPDYCGHPKFKLDCQQDNLTIDIMSQKFHIIDINQSTQILKITRLDFWVDPSCPNEYDNTNVILDFAFFNFTTNDDNITLLYDCDPPSYGYGSPVNVYPWTFTCLIDGGDRAAYLVLSTNLANSIGLGCKNSTTVPVLKVAVLSFFKNLSTLDVGYVLDEGFEVEWSGVNREQCDSCIQSGGRCGYDTSFICLCPPNQKPYGGICGKNPAWSPAPTPTPTPTPTTPTLAVLQPKLPKYSIPSHRAKIASRFPLLRTIARICGHCDHNCSRDVVLKTTKISTSRSQLRLQTSL